MSGKIVYANKPPILRGDGKMFFVTHIYVYTSNTGDTFVNSYEVRIVTVYE